MSNNLNGVRIADNQASGHHRTANDALNRIDGAVTDVGSVPVTSTNAYTVPETNLESYFHFLIEAGATSPSAAMTITVPGLIKRGLTFWRNSLTYPATISITGQTAPAIVVPAGGYALVEIDGTDARLVNYCQPFILPVEVFADATTVTSGTTKKTFRMPARVWLTEVRASLVTAQASGSLLAIDVNEGGASIFSTTLTFDNTEKTTLTATTPAVISDAAIADDAEITVDVDTVGTGAAGLKLTFIGIRY